MSIMIYEKNRLFRVTLVDIGQHTAEQALEWKRGLLGHPNEPLGYALGVCKKMDWVLEDQIQSLPAFVGFVDGYLYDSPVAVKENAALRPVLKTMPVELLESGLEFFKRFRQETDDSYHFVLHGLESLIATKKEGYL